MDEFLLKDVQVLEVLLFLNEVVLKTCNRTFHVKHTCLSILESHCSYSHEMTKNGFSGDNTKLFIPLKLALELESHDFRGSLHESEVL